MRVQTGMGEGEWRAPLGLTEALANGAHGKAERGRIEIKKYKAVRAGRSTGGERRARLVANGGERRARLVGTGVNGVHG
jgi:hypothetical protein